MAKEFGVTDMIIRSWLRQADLDAGRRTDGLTTEEKQELARLRKKNAPAPRGARHPAMMAYEGGTSAEAFLRFAREVLAMLEEKQALSRELLAGGSEMRLTELDDRELLRLVSLDLRSATSDR